MVGEPDRVLLLLAPLQRVRQRMRDRRRPEPHDVPPLRGRRRVHAPRRRLRPQRRRPDEHQLEPDRHRQRHHPRPTAESQPADDHRHRESRTDADREPRHLVGEPDRVLLLLAPLRRRRQHMRNRPRPEPDDVPPYLGRRRVHDPRRHLRPQRRRPNLRQLEPDRPGIGLAAPHSVQETYEPPALGRRLVAYAAPGSFLLTRTKRTPERPRRRSATSLCRRDQIPAQSRSSSARRAKVSIASLGGVAAGLAPVPMSRGQDIRSDGVDRQVVPAPVGQCEPSFAVEVLLVRIAHQRRRKSRRRSRRRGAGAATSCAGRFSPAAA